ncbi:MAG: M20/M25/M40 family metallo-hydrolase [Erysipelotrichaceae bacterium]|nr:M20/M25/M40 family metallo-hydrolase [Erysipelotrichaceae bacterium]
MDIFALYQNEQDYPDLKEEEAVRHLSEAVQVNTTSYLDTSRIDYAAFDELHRKLQQWYPQIMKEGTYQEIDHSILIKVEGSDPSLRPALLMAHQDVVPVVAGTEQDWQHGPFSGDIAEGYIWGRGTLDIKEMMIGELEALEYLLEHGKKLQRTLYLAFGQDEETIGSGAQMIASCLEREGVQLEFVLDESGRVSSGEVYGADVAVGSIGIYEKGYADMKLVSESVGGHSSNPFHGTSLQLLAEAITTICQNPLPAVLPDCVKESLRILAPYIKEGPLKEYVQDIDAHEQEIIAYYLSKEDLNNQIRTTIAPTMISGGSQAGNVMPQKMEAVINFRLAAQDSNASLLEHCQKLLKEEVDPEYIMANEASRVSRYDTFGFALLQQTLEHYFKDIVFVPAVNTGATDARSYEGICDCVLRFGPFLEDREIRKKGVHGTNERISRRAYLQGIRVLIRLMDMAC